MRTTITIDDDLLRRAKERAVATERTLGQVIEEALRDTLATRAIDHEPFTLHLVTAGGGGVRPGVHLDDNAALRDRMEDQ